MENKLKNLLITSALILSFLGTSAMATESHEQTLQHEFRFEIRDKIRDKIENHKDEIRDKITEIREKIKEYKNDTPECKGDCSVGEPEPEPEPETPVNPANPTPNLPGKGDRDRSEAPVKAQHWTGTCERRADGKIYVHTAFLRNQEIAHRQCRERIEAQENN